MKVSPKNSRYTCSKIVFGEGVVMSKEIKVVLPTENGPVKEEQ